MIIGACLKLQLELENDLLLHVSQLERNFNIDELVNIDESDFTVMEMAQLRAKHRFDAL